MKNTRLYAACLLLISLLMPSFSTARADAKANMETIHTYLTESYGLNCAAACGVVSNIRSESNFNPEAIGDSGAAYGICQWNSRRNALINFCEKNGYESWKSLEGQLEYLAYELDNGYKKVGTYLKNVPNTAQGAYDAAYYFCVYFEIPANRFVKGVTRGTNAVNIYWADRGGEIAAYTVSFDANGGTGAPTSKTKKEGVPLTLPASAPSRKGYLFAGWSEDKNAKVAQYASGDSISENRDILLYAVWEKSLDVDTEPVSSEEIGGHTYELYTGAYTWAFASDFAKKKGGYLVSVQSTDEYEAVSRLISKAGGACWLGGRYTNGNWAWETGEKFWDDFAERKWKTGHPSANYGANDNGCLSQSADGEWMDLVNESSENAGFIVEYGDTSDEAFPVYLITVTTSLNLRLGPGKSHTSIGYLYPDMTFTVFETHPGTSYDWGWGVADDGKSGWCAMNIPDYMIEISGIEDESGIIYQIEEENAIVTGYRGQAKSLIIPEKLAAYPVTAIDDYAFSAHAFPEGVFVPPSVTSIGKGAFTEDTRIKSAAGSCAHYYAEENGNAFEIVKPEKGLFLGRAVTELEEGAFSNASGVSYIDLSETRITKIPEDAFSDMESLRVVVLPGNITDIHESALSGSESAIFVAPKDSETERYLKASGYPHLSVSP